MTPKEKAYEIWQKMMNADLLVDSISAKQCSLVAVDEILDMNSVDKDYDLCEYWNDVKEELEKL
jgi:hypothetical protein